MKIGIDIRTACGQKTGKGWYTYNLIKELLTLDKKNEYVLYTNQITEDIADLIGHASSHVHIKVIHKNSFLWHFAVIKDFVRECGELFFAPASYIIPAFLPRKIKSVITVHDLVAFLHPHWHHNKSTLLEHLFFRMALRKTSHVLVPSNNTAEDLVRLFKYSRGKISVTPLGAAEKFHKPHDAKRLDEVRKKYLLPNEYIFTVGGLEPRKNLGLLIDAMPAEARLIIVGGKGWKSAALQKKINKAGERVQRIENVDPHDLPILYKLAKVFVFPSFYEGFGLPPLEAMASGCPVICSNASSLKEVVGDSALLFSPGSMDQLKDILAKLMGDEMLRESLSLRGRTRAKEFSWISTAEKTLEAFNKL